MKKTQKILSIVIIISLLITMNSFVVFAETDLNFDKDAYELVSQEVTVNEPLPEKYLTIEEAIERYPDTRNQNPYGLCWAFAIAACAEIELINQGVYTKEEADFSELQLAYSYFNSPYDILGGFDGDELIYDSDINYLDSAGASIDKANRVLARGNAFTFESTIPYSWCSKIERGETLEPSIAGLHDAARMINVCEVDIKNDIDSVKEAIMEHGGVYVEYFHSWFGYSEEYNVFCSDVDTNMINHAVAIIGWDNNISKTHFTGSGKPTSNGAWLARNSWTTETGASENSYFYISYEEPSFRRCISMDFEPGDIYDNTYQNAGGITHNGVVANSFANVFTVKNNSGAKYQCLESVMIDLLPWEGDLWPSLFKVEIYTNLKDLKNPTSGYLHTESVTIFKDNSYGIYTIELDAPVILEANETFSIVITPLDEEEAQMAYEASESVIEGYENGKEVNWFSVQADSDPGESFYLLYGKWKDMNLEEKGNFFITGFTTDSNKEKIELIKPKLSLSCDSTSGKPIITWNEVDCADEYEVWRKIGANGTYEKHTTTTDTQMIHTGAKAGSTYHYKVRAVSYNENRKLYSSFSNSDYITCDLKCPTIKLKNDEASGKPIITWNKVEGAAKYEVWRKIGSNGTYEKHTTTTNTQMIHTGAKAGTSYYYKVKAIYENNSAANSAFSSSDYITCDLAKPVVSVGNIAETGKIKLSWDKVPGASYYQIYRADYKNGTYEKMFTTTNLSYINTNAKFGKTYYYKVKAIFDGKSAANSAFSDIVYRTCDLPTPTNISIYTTSSTGKPTLTWDKVEGADKYEIWRATSKSGEYTKMSTQSSNKYTNTSAKSGNKYYYKIRAIDVDNSNANSAYSDVKSITCDLENPTANITTVASSGKPKVTWNKVEGADQYEIWRATSKDGEYTKYYTTTSTSYTNTAAKPGYTYYYKVKAIYSNNTNANSAFSDVKYITCDCAKPSVSISRNDSGKPKLSWNTVSGASKYEIWRATSKTGTYEKYYTTTKTSFTNTGAKSGKTYYYKVKAICGRSSYGNSAYSSVVSITAK